VGTAAARRRGRRLPARRHLTGLPRVGRTRQQGPGRAGCPHRLDLHPGLRPCRRAAAGATRARDAAPDGPHRRSSRRPGAATRRRPSGSATARRGAVARRAGPLTVTCAPVGVAGRTRSDGCRRASTEKLIVFDVNETLSDLRPMSQRFPGIGLPAQLAYTWFAPVLRDGTAPAAAGDSATFSTIAEGVLRSPFPQHAPDRGRRTIRAADRGP